MYNNLQFKSFPPEWKVIWNNLTDLDPLLSSEDDTELWWNFTEDLLQLQYQTENIIIDLGWYPDCDPKGTFKIFFMKDYDWKNAIDYFETRSKSKAISKIEELTKSYKALKI